MTDSLTQRLLFVAAGTYDAEAEHKSREGALRKVVWESKPPLQAQKIEVLYDGNQRAQVWKMTFHHSQIDWPAMQKRQTSRGEINIWPATEPTLTDAILWKDKDIWILETRAYLIRHDPEFLKEVSY